MSIGRNHPTTNNGIRDAEADYIDAHVAEYEAYCVAGLTEKAAAVADVLDQLQHSVRPERPTEGAKERAVTEPALETAVNSDEAPKRRPGRPKKVVEE